MAFAGSSGGSRPGRTDSSTTTGGGDDAATGGARPQTTAWRESGRGATDDPAAEPRRPRGRPFTRRLDLDVDVDWERAGTFGAGVALGALLGAGVALLLAPHSGVDTRRRLRKAGRRTGSRAADAWADLGEELRHAAFRARRKARRSLRGGAALGDLAHRVRSKREQPDERDEGGWTARLPRRRRAVEVEIDD
jgi:hypothetical protein